MKNFYLNHGKRWADLVITTTVITLALPLLLGVSLLVLRRIGWPVIFKQVRPGRYGKPFTLYKFRTMSEERDSSGKLLPNELRLSRFGRMLRSSSLDELPELFNVFKGDMSIVGPRPLLMDYLPLYTKEEARRHDVRGGITGLAQVSGRNDLEFKERFKLDIEYIDHVSFALDIRIMLRTFFKVLKRESVVVDERQLRQRFEAVNTANGSK